MTDPIVCVGCNSAEHLLWVAVDRTVGIGICAPCAAKKPLRELIRAAGALGLYLEASGDFISRAIQECICPPTK